MLLSMTWSVCIGLHNGIDGYNNDSSPILVTHMTEEATAQARLV